MADDQNAERVVSDNSTYTSSTALQLRLNPENILLQLEKELRGGMYNLAQDPQTGEVYTKFEKYGEPLMNPKGIQSVMRTVRSVVNTGTVMGNLDKDEYVAFMKDFHRNLATELVSAKYDYDIKSNTDLRNILNNIVYFVRLFLTRTIGDGERKNMQETVKEHYAETGQKSRFNLGFTKGS